MIRKLLLPFFSLTFFTARTQSLVLADQFHGNNSQINSCSTTDAAGNMFTLCNFWADVDINPGPGTTSYTAFGTMDIALVKLNSAGSLVWGGHIGGTGFDSGSEIKTDAAGNIFIFGYYNGTIDMDPSVATYNLASYGSDDIFCAKYDPSGNLLWAKHIGGTGTEQNYGFDLDAAGNCYLFGYFQNTVDFDPGPGISNLTSSVNVADFLLKLDNNGNFQWVKALGTYWGEKLMIDNADNIYTTGHFWGTIDFNPGAGIYNLSAFGFGADAVTVKLDNAGNFIWASAFSGTMDDLAYDISANAADNSLVVVGNFQGTMDSDPGPAVVNLISAAYVDGFIIKLNAASGALIWGKTVGGTDWQSVDGVKTDASGNLHMTGTFNQTVDFDPGVGIANLTSAGSTDIFRLVWTSDGNYSGAERIGGTSDDWVQSIELDNTGTEIITGQFDGLVDFDPGPGTLNFNSAFTGWDGFLAKYCTSYTINNYVSICNGDSYFAGGAFQTTAGDYYDYYTPAFGCDSTVITHLSINSPVVNLGADDGICSGTSLVLDAANPGATYLWNTGATTQTLTVSAAGTYSVTITDGAGCTASDAINITVNPAPVADLGPDITACAGTTITLDAGNPGANYLWNTGAITKTIHPAVTGNYSVTVTNAFGCSDNDVVHVTVNPLPVVDLGPDTGICDGATLTLDAENPGATYLWNTGATTQTLGISVAGIYSVTVTNAGCAATDAINITVNPSPVVDLGPDITACAGTTLTLDAGNPGANYLWNTGATTKTIHPTITGNYSVTVTNAFGCTDNDVVHVTINALPVVDLGADADICAGENIILDAENAGADYNWNTGATTQTITVSDAGTYRVTVTNLSGCMAADSINVIIHTSPIVDLGADMELCEGETVLLDAGNPDADFIWNTGATTQTITASSTGNYSVVVTNAFGCSNNDLVHITVHSAPIVDLGGTVSFCENATAILDAENTGSTYLWSTGETTQQITIVADGVYSVTVTNAFGCSATASVTASTLIAPVVDAGPDQSFCDGNAVIIDATIPFESTYLWNTGATSSNITAIDAGEYIVTATNIYGCSDMDTVIVEVLPIPEVDLILPATEICSDDAAFVLTGGTPAGGEWSGDGITDSIFDPAIAGIGEHLITYTYTNDLGCTATATEYVSVDICQGIESFINNIQIYPNPAMQYFIIDGSTANTVDRYVIMDITGKIILTGNMNGSEKQFVDIRSLSAGNYIIQLSGEKLHRDFSLIVIR